MYSLWANRQSISTQSACFITDSLRLLFLVSDNIMETQKQLLHHSCQVHQTPFTQSVIFSSWKKHTTIKLSQTTKPITNSGSVKYYLSIQQGKIRKYSCSEHCFPWMISDLSLAPLPIFLLQFFQTQNNNPSLWLKCALLLEQSLQPELRWSTGPLPKPFAYITH